jgi:hypothetical protein
MIGSYTERFTVPSPGARNAGPTGLCAVSYEILTLSVAGLCGRSGPLCRRVGLRLFMVPRCIGREDCLRVRCGCVMVVALCSSVWWCSAARRSEQLVGRWVGSGFWLLCGDVCGFSGGSASGGSCVVLRLVPAGAVAVRRRLPGVRGRTWPVPFRRWRGVSGGRRRVW